MFSSSTHSVGCCCCLLHSLWMLLHQSTIHNTSSQVYPLVVSLIHTVHKNDTTTHLAYTKLHSERPVSYATWQVLFDGLACTAFDTSSSLRILHPLWPVCAGGGGGVLFQTHLLGCLQSAVWIQMLVFHRCSSSVSVTKVVYEMQLASSLLISWTISKCRYEFCIVMLWRQHHMNTQEVKAEGFWCLTLKQWWIKGICLHFLLQINYLLSNLLNFNHLTSNHPV
jgi:hypothetical protein